MIGILRSSKSLLGLGILFTRIFGSESCFIDNYIYCFTNLRISLLRYGIHSYNIK
jgi:hypothetical protein